MTRSCAPRIKVRVRMYDPQTGRFTQEDPIGLAGGLNAYGFASGDPVNFGDHFGLDSLRAGERDRLGERCAQADCKQMEVYRGDDIKAMNALRSAVLTLSHGRSVTLGRRIFIADAARGDFAVLAHETQHVVQYEKWGASEYLRIGLNERGFELTGGNPYAHEFSGRRLSADGMQQQGQIVEDCFRGKTGACWVFQRP